MISPRNSASAIAHLLAETKSKYLLVTKELVPLMEAALAIMETAGAERPESAAMPIYEDLFKDEVFAFLPPVQRTKIDDLAYIVHSSGMFRKLANHPLHSLQVLYRFYILPQTRKLETL